MSTQPINDGKIHKGQLWRTKGYGQIHTIRVVDPQALTWNYTHRPWEIHCTGRSVWHDKWVLFADIDSSGYPTSEHAHGTTEARMVNTARTAAFTFEPWGRMNERLRSEPPSAILDSLRDQISRIRMDLSALGSALPIWDERLEAVRGGLTLCLVDLYRQVSEAKQIEGKQP